LLQDKDAYKTIVVGYDEPIERLTQEAWDYLKQSIKLEVSTCKTLASNKILKSLNWITVNISAQEFTRALQIQSKSFSTKNKLLTR
jgi:hypothetical protein